MSCDKCSKIKLLMFDCRCGETFCSKCKMPEKHNCNFDYKEHAKNKLKINNPLVINNKIKKI